MQITPLCIRIAPRLADLVAFWVYGQDLYALSGSVRQPEAIENAVVSSYVNPAVCH